MNTPVKYELAKLLKEKGFDIPTLYFYLDGSLKYNHSIKPRNSNVLLGTLDVSAPTIAEVVMWIYEKHGIWIEVQCPDVLYELWSYTVHKPHKCGNYGSQNSFDTFNSPTEAYETAIEDVLNNLI